MRLGINSFIKKLYLFVIIFAVCLSAKIVVCILPNESIQHNVKVSYDNIKARGNFINMPIVTGYDDRLDYWTESAYISATFLIDNKDPLKSSMLNKTVYNSKDTVGGGGHALASLLENAYDTERQNSQYWWGIIVFLRPMLMFFTYEQTISIFQMIFWFIMFVTIILIKEKLGFVPSVAFIIGILGVGIVTASMLLHTAVVFLLACIGVILMLKYQKGNNSVDIMIIMGTLTAYFDWMSTPIITFSFPMIYAFIILYKNGFLNNWYDGFKCFVKSAIAWAVSYYSMLMSKWILSSIVLKENTIAKAMERAIDDVTKASSDVPDGLLNYIYQSFKKNIECLELVSIIPEKNRSLFFIILIAVIIIIVLLFKSSKKSVEACAHLVLLTSVAPIAWIIVFRGHMYIHYWFTYRNFSVLLTGVIMYLYIIIDAMKIKIGLQKVKFKNDKNY